MIETIINIDATQAKLRNYEESTTLTLANGGNMRIVAHLSDEAIDALADRLAVHRIKDVLAKAGEAYENAFATLTRLANLELTPLAELHDFEGEAALGDDGMHVEA